MKKITRKQKGYVATIVSIILMAGLISCADKVSDNNSENKTFFDKDKVYEEMIKVNTREAVLSRHNNLFVETEIYKTDLENASHRDIYTENDCIYIKLYGETDSSDNDKNEVIEEFHTQSDCYIRSRTKDKDDFLLLWYVMSEAERNEKLQKLLYFEYCLELRDKGEEVISVKDNGDGTITMITHTDIEKFPFGQVSVPDDWKGSVVVCEYNLDAKNYEANKIYVWIDRKGEKISYYTDIISFDIEESEDCKSMKAFAKKIDEKNYTATKTITAYYNYGTAEEEKYEAQRDDSFFLYAYPRDGYFPCKDPEGTNVIFDNNTAVEVNTIYYVEDQKVFNNIYDKCLEASSVNVIFSKHKNFSTYEIFGEAGKMTGFEEEGTELFGINEKDLMYIEDKKSSEDDSYVFVDKVLKESNIYCHRYKKDGSFDKYTITLYAMSEDDKSKYFNNKESLETDLLVDGREDGETVETVYINDDGNLCLILTTPIEKSASSIDHNISDELKGGTILSTLIVDPKTFELHGVITDLILDDRRMNINSDKIEYDVDEPESLTALKAFAEKIEKQDFVPTRTVTVIYNPGTENEEKYSLQTDATFDCSLIYNTNYSIYLDAEGKNPIGTDYVHKETDETFYLIKKDKSL